MSTVPAAWSDDCSGKKDFDAELVSLSSRYWPRGGSHTVFHRTAAGVTLESDGRDPERQRTIPPSANSTIYLRVGELEDDLVLAEQNFTGETQEDVQRQVEAWAQAQYDRIATALQKEFLP